MQQPKHVTERGYGFEIRQCNSVSVCKFYFFINRLLYLSAINTLEHPVPHDANVTSARDENIEDDAEEDGEKEDEYDDSEMEDEVDCSDGDVDYSSDNEFQETETDSEYAVISLYTYSLYTYPFLLYLATSNVTKQFYIYTIAFQQMMSTAVGM